PKKTQGLLPRGAAAQSPTKQERSGGRHRRPQAGGRGRAAGARGSTAEGREGARAKRARGLRPKNRPPPRLRRYSPSKLGEKSAPPRPSGPPPPSKLGEKSRTLREYDNTRLKMDYSDSLKNDTWRSQIMAKDLGIDLGTMNS